MFLRIEAVSKIQRVHIKKDSKVVNDIRLQRVILFLVVIVGSSLNTLLAQEGKLPGADTMKHKNTFNIVQHGAVEGGEVLCTQAIQSAIDACTQAGGGRVVVPAGTFSTGTVFLKDGVNLQLEKDAVLLGSKAFPHDYPQLRLTTKHRYEWFLHYALIFAQGANNIAVTGEGTLIGTPSKVQLWHGREKERPLLLWFDECTNVTVQGVTFKRSGMWTETYTRCFNVHVNGITVTESSFHNNDGCNIVDCDNFLVENCDINALDDAICLKGYTSKGCNNIVIRNNRVRSLCNGIKVGTDSSGGFRNILIENNEVYHTGIAGIALEVVDGGVMENVIVRNINMDVVGTPIFIKLGERGRPIYVDGVETKAPMGVLRDVKISGIRATVNKPNRSKQEGSKHNYHPYASSITGVPGHFIENVVIDDVDIEIVGGFPLRTKEEAQREIPENSKGYPENRMFGVLPAHGFYIRHAKGIKMTNIRVAIMQADARSAFVLDDVHDSVFQNIHTENVTSTSPFSVQSNCTGVDVKMKKRCGKIPRYAPVPDSVQGVSNAQIDLSGTWVFNPTPGVIKPEEADNGTINIVGGEMLFDESYIWLGHEAIDHYDYRCPDKRYQHPVEGVKRQKENAPYNITWLNKEQITEQLIPCQSIGNKSVINK